MRVFSPLTLFAAAALFLVFSVAAVSQQMTFDSSSKIWVEGTSNVHDWTCEVKQFGGNLNANISDGVLTGFEAASVTVPVAQLDCNNGQMNRLMRRTMNADTHQQISFQLTDARVGQPSNGAFLTELRGRLTINGTTRNVQFRADGRTNGSGYQLSGSVPVKMSDYGMSAPTAMLGAMRTSDDVTVRFDVTLRR